MDAILSDCGIALYGNAWWIELEYCEWDDILAGAKRIGYPFRHIMKMMRETESNREMALLIRIVRDQHKRVYKWFKSDHGQNSYLGSSRPTFTASSNGTFDQAETRTKHRQQP